MAISQSNQSFNLSFPVSEVGVWAQFGRAVLRSGEHILQGSINDIGVCFCSKEKSDANNIDTDMERTRLMPTSLPGMLFPLEGQTESAP